MKKNKRYYPIIILVITCLSMLPFQTSGQKNRKAKKNVEKKQDVVKAKLTYKNYIWLEGENAVSTNFAKEKTYNYFCSGRHALQLSKEADPSTGKGYYANYVFYVPRTKRYDFWIGCSPPGSISANKTGYSSPFQWKIDNENFNIASSENTHVKNFYAPGSYYWVKVKTRSLEAGKHTLTIRVNQKRSSGWDYYFYLDALVFIPTYSKYLEPIMNFPESAPKDFQAKGKGITFQKPASYQRMLANREAVLTLVNIHIWLFEYNKAINVLQNYLKKNRKDIQMRILLASNYAWADNLNRAIAEYKNIIRIDKKNIVARKQMAVLAGWNNRYGEAIKNYREIIEIDPKNIDAYISLANQLNWSGQVKKALGIFQKAEAIAPDNIEVLYTLGDNYHWAGKTYEAAQKFKKIISINEKEINAYKKLARLYLDMGKKSSSKSILADAALIQKTYPELANISLDIEGDREKEARNTIEEYQLALKKNPENIEKRKSLIETYIWNKMEDKAIEEYNNLLNMKVYKEVNEADSKLASLQLEIIKFQLAREKLQELSSKIGRISSEYGTARERIKNGKSISGDFTTSKVTRDLRTINQYKGMVDMYENSLSNFKDIMNIHASEVQSYLAQKDALKWSLDKRRLIRQARNSSKSMPSDFRPRKVIGAYELIYGGKGSAAASLKSVYDKSPNRAVPMYIYTLSEAGRMTETQYALRNAVKNSKVNTQLKQKLNLVSDFLKKFQQNIKAEGVQPAGDKKKQILSMGDLAVTTESRMQELLQEQEDKIRDAREIIKNLFEKSMLDLENDNVPIYKEIAQYHLNNANMYQARQFYNSILQVQPMNVETNFQMGNLMESSGYWKSAKDRYEIAINNQPDHKHAVQSHYNLQKEFAPSLSDTFTFFHDLYGGKQITMEFKNELSTNVPLNDWFTIKAGYDFVMFKDKGGVSNGGQSYLPSKGEFMSHSGYAGVYFNIVPIDAKLYGEVRGNYYIGSIKFSDSDYSKFTVDDIATLSTNFTNSLILIRSFNTSFQYMTLNYKGALEFTPYIKGVRLKAGYSFEDMTDTTQALQMKYRNRITAQVISAGLDLSLEPYDFPLSKRIFFNGSFDYRIISDGNTQMSTYNELTFRILRFPTHNIYLDLSGIVNYEQSAFTQYRDNYVSPLPVPTNLPYWAPKGNLGISGNIRFDHTVENFLKGQFQYTPWFKFTYEYINQYSVFILSSTLFMPADESFTQMGYSAGITLKQTWDLIELSLGYNYSNSWALQKTLSNHMSTSLIENNRSIKNYEAHQASITVTGRFFSIYKPKGLGKEPIIMATASPGLITADNDGKDDYTTITLTSFDERGIARWNLDFYNEKGRKVHSIGRSGNPPSTIKWDGTDKSFKMLPQGTYFYQLVIENSGKVRSQSKKGMVYLSRKKRAVTIETSYEQFSPNNDGSKDTMSYNINATEKEGVRNWTLTILRGNAAVRTMSGREFMPYDVLWDGTSNAGKTVPDGEYGAKISVTYNDNTRIESPVTKVRVVTKTLITISAVEKEVDPARGILTIKPKTGVKDMESWKLTIKSPDNRVMKIKQGSGKVPVKISVNCLRKDKTLIGYNMPVNITMEIRDKAGNKGMSNELTLWLGFLVKTVNGKKVVVIFNQGLLHRGSNAAMLKTGDAIVAKLGTVLRVLGARTITVSAHTSTDGSEKINLDMSNTRARLMKDKIMGVVKPLTAKSRGAGETTPYIKGKPSVMDDRYEIIIE